MANPSYGDSLWFIVSFIPQDEDGKPVSKDFREYAGVVKWFNGNVPSDIPGSYSRLADVREIAAGVSAANRADTNMVHFVTYTPGGFEPGSFSMTNNAEMRVFLYPKSDALDLRMIHSMTVPRQ